MLRTLQVQPWRAASVSSTSLSVAAYGIDSAVSDRPRVQVVAPLHPDSAAAVLHPPSSKPALTTSSSQQLPAAVPPPPTLENAFHVSVAPVTQALKGPPVDVVLIVSIGPILFRNPTTPHSLPAL
jgi:hypothetical protein